MWYFLEATPSSRVSWRDFRDRSLTFPLRMLKSRWSVAVVVAVAQALGPNAASARGSVAPY